MIHDNGKIKVPGLFLLCLLTGGAFPAGGPQPYTPPSSPAVQERLEWFQDQKLGLMMHFGLYSVLGITESWPLVSEDASWARNDVEWTEDDETLKRQYYELNRVFNPIRFNATAWARTAKRCGFRYVTFTTKHHDGFCLWDTKQTSYKTTDPACPYSSNPNADIVRRLFDACRAEGLGVSAYFSKPDFHHEDYWENGGIGRSTTRFPTYDVCRQPEKWNRFKRFFGDQILELVRGYGPIDILWLDGGWLCKRGPKPETDMEIGKVAEEARRTNPGLIVVDRWSSDEYMNIATPEQCVPEKPLPYPWESCITMSDGWGYHYDDHYKSTRELIHLIVDIVAKGGNLALNVGPMPDGRLPAPALERLEAIGRWLARNGEAIYGTRAVSPFSFKQCRYTRGKNGKYYAIRLWKEGERHLVRTVLNLPDGVGRVSKVVHLATGGELRFEPYSGHGAKGVEVFFDADFVMDDSADAFEIRVGE